MSTSQNWLVFLLRRPLLAMFLACSRLLLSSRPAIILVPLSRSDQWSRSFRDHVTKKRRALGTRMAGTFSLSRNEKINWKPSSERSQENECYRRLIYKQFVPVSGLCGPQFLSYLPKRFTHLCMETSHWCSVLVWPPEINKNIWSSLFL